MEELAQVSIFQKLSSEDLAKLVKIATKRSFPVGTVVFFEGDRADALYVILTGSVKVYRTFDDGREKVLATLGHGDFFGEYAILDGHPRSASVTAIAPTEMLSIAQRDFRTFANGSPDVLWKVIEAVCERLKTVTEAHLDTSFRDVPYRLTQAIVRLAEKHGRATAEGCRLDVNMKPKDLASLAYTTPERVSRLLAKMERRDLIQVHDDHLLVPDLKTLKRSLEYVDAE